MDVLISGTGAGAGLGRPAAGKTGTTDDYKDAWFVGFTPNLSCAVWIGDDRSRSMGLMTGSMTPLSIWHAFMSRAIREIPYANFVRPAGAVTPRGEDIGKPEDKDKDKDKDKDAVEKDKKTQEEGKLKNATQDKKTDKAAKQPKPAVSNKPSTTTRR